ncbi:MAG: helix-turn-helix transcriptional regulator, partial [Victivallales bacterium]
FTGMTPLQVINLYRMEYAAVQLRMTSKEITDIASECGFDSLSHFYRVFKSFFKLPPGNYRKRYRMLVYQIC